MGQPKFSVGEVVILQSIDHSEFNGEYTIEGVLPIGHKEMSLCNRVRIEIAKETAYKIDLVVRNKKTGHLSCIFSENVLRKKHQPGEMNFTSLMASLNNPVGVV